MTSFDGVLISIVFAGVYCVISIMFSIKKKDKKATGFIAASVVIILAIIGLCMVAKYYGWESEILNIKKDDMANSADINGIGNPTDELIAVPNVCGYEQTIAVEKLESMGFAHVVYADGNNVGEIYYVIKQSIPENARVAKGTEIALELSCNKPET